MAISNQQILQDIRDPDLGQSSIYDRPDQDERELWFLPQGASAGDDPGFAQRPRADQRMLFDPADWGRAQADLSSELAALSFRFGALDARLAAMGDGNLQRLAIAEAAAMSWGAGTRIGAERLALWLGQRSGGGMEDSLALAQAGWAVRRMVAGQAPDVGGWVAGVGAFLGYGQATQTFAAAELAEVMAPARHLHTVTQSAMVFYAWHIIARSPARTMEAAVMAACHGASMAGRSSSGGGARATFLPIALGGGLRMIPGNAHARLAGWIASAEQATRAAVLQVDRATLWQAAAHEALSDLSGRTPMLLIKVLAAWPMVSAPMAEAQTSASRAAVQRNLDLMLGRGLIREISGQGRYRVWAAKM